MARQAAEAAPVRGIANLIDKEIIPGFQNQRAYSGEVAFDDRGVPVGVWVDVPEGRESHYANVARHFIPASACAWITIRK